MTLDTTSNVKTYTGNASTTAFSTVFVFYDPSDLIVKVAGETVTLDGAGTYDYSVTGGSGAAGTVTFNNAPASSASIIIQRFVDYKQDTDFENFDGNPSDVTEKQFDLVVMQTQQLNEIQDRSLTVPVGTSGFSGEIPDLAGNGENYLRLKSDLSGFEFVSVQSSGDIAVSSYIETLLDDTTASDARTTLGLGTIATQGAGSVAITGGSISGLSSLGVDNVSVDGNTISSTTGALNLNGTTTTTVGGSRSNSIAFSNTATLSNAGATFGNYLSTTYQSNVTAAYNVYSLPRLENTSWTLPSLSHFYAEDVVEGSGAVTNQFGFNVPSTMTTGTNNYGFYGNLASGTGRYNIYMNGTAPNYFKGEIQSANGQVAFAQGFFDGTAGTPSFTYDWNFGAITDNGTGDYTCAFTTSSSSANYTVSIVTGSALATCGVTTKSTGSVRIAVKNAFADTGLDAANVNVIVFASV